MEISTTKSFIIGFSLTKTIQLLGYPHDCGNCQIPVIATMDTRRPCTSEVGANNLEVSLERFNRMFLLKIGDKD